MKSIPSEANSVLAEIGSVLLALQFIEYQLSICIKILHLTSKDEVSMVAILAVDRHTLGRLILEFKKHIDLDSEFESNLISLLVARNTLIHKLQFESWFDLQSHGGREKLFQFIYDLNQLCLKANSIITSYFLAEGRKYGVADPIPKTIMEELFIKEMNEDYIPRLNKKI